MSPVVRSLTPVTKGVGPDDPGAKRTMSPFARLDTYRAPSGPAVMLSGKKSPSSSSSLGSDARAAADPVPITNPPTSSTTARIRPIYAPFSTGLSIAILLSVCR
jgi:hypothetical protein